MTKKIFTLKAQDTLFFRDAVPMSAGQGAGNGARMPLPSTLHEALRTALLTSANALPNQKSRHGRDAKPFASPLFQSLRLGALLPCFDGNPLWTMPLDTLVTQTTSYLKLYSNSNASKPLTHLALSPKTANKHTSSGWLNQEQITAWTQGKSIHPDLLTEDKLWLKENRVGLAIDPEKLAGKEGQLFAGSYLRMKKEASFACMVALGKKEKPDVNATHLHTLKELLWGGDRRMVSLSNGLTEGHFLIPQPQPEASPNGKYYIKWALMTPAIFANGWLPGWVCENGKQPDGIVRLKDISGVRLCATALGKPIPISGWDTLLHAPKPTQLAIPAGSVYYFECDSAQQASQLIQKLHFNPNGESFNARSDFFGEKGYGIGICGIAQTFSTSTK